MNNVIFTGRILNRTALPGGYTQARIAPPAGMQPAQPGQYLQLAGQPWPVLRSGPGWLDCLRRSPSAFGDNAAVEAAGPCGEAFTVATATPRALLLGSESGVAPALFLAERLRNHRPRVKSLVLLASAHPFPFQPAPSRIMTPGLPAWVIASVPLLEDWGVPSRLASSLDPPGCFDGGVDELARGWLDVSQGVADVTVYACGPADLLSAARRLAADYRLPCQTVPAAPEVD